MSDLGKNAWLSFKDVVKNFLANTRAITYTEIFQKLLECYRALGCNMSIKLGVIYKVRTLRFQNFRLSTLLYVHIPFYLPPSTSARIVFFNKVMTEIYFANYYQSHCIPPNTSARIVFLTKLWLRYILRLIINQRTTNSVTTWKSYCTKLSKNAK